MPTQDPHEWWAERCAHIAELMKNTGVGELIIRRKSDGKYSFELTPEADNTPKLPPHGQPYPKGMFETVGVKQFGHNAQGMARRENGPPQQ
jgi:hypothetical protein